MHRKPKDILKLLKEVKSGDKTIDSVSIVELEKELSEIDSGLNKGIKLMKDMGRIIDPIVLENRQILDECLDLFSKIKN